MLTLLLALAPILAPSIQELPAPSGPARVGTKVYELVDPSRPDPVAALTPTDERVARRVVAVQAFYPVAAKEQPADLPGAMYVSEELAERLVADGFYDQSAELLRGLADLRTQALHGAAPAEGAKPTVLLSHGLGTGRFLHTALAIELASHGYLVLAVDHPYGGVTRLRDGRFLSAGDDPELEGGAFGLRQTEWAADLHFVLGQLKETPLAELGPDAGRVAAIGHSMGGAAALEAGSQGPGFGAVINMDGAPIEFESGSVRCDALLLMSHPVYSDADLAARGRTREAWEAMGSRIRDQWADRRGPDAELVLVAVRGTGHLSFSDAPFLMPDTITRFGGDVLAPARTHEVTCDLVRAYLQERFEGELRLAARIAAWPEAIERALD